MRSEQSPFPPYWWATGIWDVPERSKVSTYGRYEHGVLPPLPFQIRGTFNWLSDKPAQKSHIGQEKASENERSLKSLMDYTAGFGLNLPEPFVKFFQSSSLQERVRSTTDCFLDLCPALIKSPLGEGYLVRFLADSQSCVFWYLFLTVDAEDHAVVSSPDFYGTADEQWQDEQPDPSEIVFAEESFEAFICRFWLENEICFSQFNSTPLLDVGTIYLEQYRGRK